MSQTFVPFAPASSAHPGVFTPFNSRVASTRLTVGKTAPASGAPVTAAAASHENCSEPVLTLTRDGERVTAIHISCPCGQVIEMKCSY